MSMMDKILRLLGMQDEHEDEVEQEFDLEEMGVAEMVNPDCINTKPMRMVVLNCRFISDATQVINNLKINRPVIVTLAEAEPDESQRIIDFVSGAVYAIEGELEKITADTFVFAPKNFVVDKEKCEEIVKEDTSLFIKEIEL